MRIPPAQFCGTNWYRNPPFTEAARSFAEAQLGVTLPEEYIALLRHQNGGYTRGFAFPMPQGTSWAADHVPLRELAGIVLDRAHRGAHDILLTPHMTREWGLPPRQVLLAGDGHWWITLDYRRHGEPRRDRSTPRHPLRRNPSRCDDGWRVGRAMGTPRFSRGGGRMCGREGCPRSTT